MSIDKSKAIESALLQIEKIWKGLDNAARRKAS
jgi:hypothetical protein